MILSEVFDLFAKKCPVPVMVRATLENTLCSDRLDALFASTARRQHPSELLFSMIVDLMGTVVSQVRPSLRAAFLARADEISVSLNAVYDKVQGIETSVSRELVRDTARHMTEIMEHMGSMLPELLPGYRTKIIDGNHLPSSERRLKELRQMNAAPLPGKSLVILDPASMLAIDVIPCEDGHAQERRLFPQVLETVEADDLILADRNFCTMNFLGGIADRDAFFLIRQHGASVRYEMEGRRRKVGRSETGTVYEQEMCLLPVDDEAWLVRRVTVKLHETTRDGDEEIHLLTNLPPDVDAKEIAKLYRKRWTVETAFQELEATLNGELQTLAYPKAALFAFCVALVSYNVMSVVKAALRAVHGVEKVQNEVSGYYLAQEISVSWGGMMHILPPKFWKDRFVGKSSMQMSRYLLKLARDVQLAKFPKATRTKRKKPTTKMNKKKRRHVSTARILEKRRPISSK